MRQQDIKTGLLDRTTRALERMNQLADFAHIANQLKVLQQELETARDPAE